jgi:hypothetical protein
LVAHHGLELGQAGRGVVGLFQLAHVDEAHPVALQNRHGLVHVGGVVQRRHVVLAPVYHLVAYSGALLLLVPIPADDGGQPGIHRDAAAPAIERRHGLGDDG